MSEILIATDSTEIKLRVSGFGRFRSVFFGRALVVYGTFVIMAFIITSIFAPVLAPYDPYAQDLKGALAKPSPKNWLGTDALGRDSLSRIIYGARVSLMIGLVAVGMAALSGMTMGLIAGYFGGRTNMIIMRLIDALMAFPPIMKALVIAALLGGGLKNVMIALGFGMLPAFARLMCGQVLSVKESDYVTAAHSIGAGHLRIMLRHIVPNSFPPLIVLITIQMGQAILLEAGLSFLGIGIEAPTAAWGGMVSDGYHYLASHPVLCFAPGLAIMLVIFAFNMVGDGLRDALDPRLRGTL